MKTYDYIVWGGGPGGISLARALAREKKVALLERDKLGGTGMRTGALPVKRLLDSFKNGADKEQVLTRLNRNWKRDLKDLDRLVEARLAKENIDVYYGEGEFLKPGKIKINGEVIQGKKSILATGSRPKSLDNISLDGSRILSHKDLVEDLKTGQEFVVYGGNVEGVEIASFLQLLSNKVTIVEREDHILHEKDRDLIKPIEDEFIKRGGRILTSSKVLATKVMGARVYTYLDKGEVLVSDYGVLTFSREANLPRGIENTGLDLRDGWIGVGENFRTKDRNIYAIGDVNGLHGMAHVAMDQARLLAGYLLKAKEISYDYSLVPGAYFTIPEYVGIGPCEKDLEPGYLLGKVDLKEVSRGWTREVDAGFIKVILGKDGKLLAIHMVGGDVAEYLGFLGYFIGREASEILSVLPIYPSFASGIKEAIGQAFSRLG